MTSAAPTMLSTAATMEPTAEDSSTLPGESTNETSMIATSSRPADRAVRPAVLAAMDAAWRTGKPLSRPSRNRVMISSE